MRIGGAGIASLVLMAFLIGGTAAVAASPTGRSPGISAHPGAAVSITVSVGDSFSFSLSANEVQPGDLVTITLVELGATAHTFTLSPVTNFLFNTSDSTTHLLAFFSAHKPLVNLSVNGTIPGERHSQTFVAPAYGQYEYVCTQPAHFPSMSGTLGSGEPGSGTTLATGPGWQVFAIGGGIASLVVITIVLAFAIGQRPGAKHEMPPERLGYPEGPSPPTPPPH